MLYAVWLPHEAVMIGNGPHRPPTPVIGYVLAYDPGGWMTILVSGNHELMRVRDSRVRSRRVCQRTPSASFWSQVTDQPTLWQEVTSLAPLRFLHPGISSCGLQKA